MTHIGTQRIETERLILRRFELSDAPAMFANWASDDEVTTYLTWPTHADVSVTEGILEKWGAQYGQDDCYRWAIVLKENGPQPIGSIDGCRWHEDGTVLEIGYCMGRRWWHRGIMSEALGAVIDFLFRRVGVERIVALHDTKNLYSQPQTRSGRAFCRHTALGFLEIHKVFRRKSALSGGKIPRPAGILGCEYRF